MEGILLFMPVFFWGKFQMGITWFFSNIARLSSKAVEVNERNPDKIQQILTMYRNKEMKGKEQSIVESFLNEQLFNYITLDT